MCVVCVCKYTILVFLWLSLLCMTISRYIHISANGTVSFLFVAEKYPFVYMYHVFIHPSVDGRLGCFLLLFISYLWFWLVRKINSVNTCEIIRIVPCTSKVNRSWFLFCYYYWCWYCSSEPCGDWNISPSKCYCLSRFRHLFIKYALHLSVSHQFFHQYPSPNCHHLPPECHQVLYGSFYGFYGSFWMLSCYTPSREMNLFTYNSGHVATAHSPS